MDTTNEALIGRKSGRSGRKLYTLEEKLQVVRESLAPGNSVSRVARRYDINTNLAFTWRRQYQDGELTAPSSALVPALLPVEVTAKRKRTAVASAPAEPERGIIEIDLCGVSIRIHGSADSKVLAQVLSVLDRR